jgi:amino acid transporter
MGTFTLAASIVNVTIGGGIFRLPADMAATLGATAPLAYLLCAIAMGLIVLCMAEAGSRVSITGGPYAYVEVAFGPFVGFLAGFLLWMLLTFAMAAVATVLVASLGALVPALASRGAAAAVLVAIYAVFATINILGVERGARVNSALTVAKILPLLLLIAGGIFAMDPDNFAIGDPPDMPTLARSSILLIFAFAGIEAALVPGGEVKDPVRTVPRAIFIAMAAITVLYAGLQVVAQGVLGPALATSKAAPLSGGRRRGAWRMGERPAAHRRRDLDARPGWRDDPGRAAHAVRVRARRIPTVGGRASPSRASIAGRRDPPAVRDRARARDHQHIRSARDSREPLGARAVWDVLPRDVAAPPPRRARRRHAL